MHSSDNVKYHIKKGTEIWRCYPINSKLHDEFGTFRMRSVRDVVYTKEDLVEGPCYLCGKFGYYMFKTPDRRYPWFKVHEDNMFLTYED